MQPGMPNKKPPGAHFPTAHSRIQIATSGPTPFTVLTGMHWISLSVKSPLPTIATFFCSVTDKLFCQWPHAINMLMSESVRAHCKAMGQQPQRCQEPYDKVLDHVQESLRALDDEGRFLVEDPVHNEIEDVCLSSNADDIATKLCGNSAQELAGKSLLLNNHIDSHSANIGMAQNRSKQEHVPFFARAGTRANYAAILDQCLLPGNAHRSAPYLGPPYDFNGSTKLEMQQRISAAKLGWVCFGRFWSRGSTTADGRLCVFRGMVYTPLLSGLEACVLDKSDYSALDKSIQKLGRNLMRGLACQKVRDSDGGIKHEAKLAGAAWKFLGILPSRDELYVRRIRWHQALAQEPLLHMYWFACMFGHFLFETSETVVGCEGHISPTAHPWAQQFADDMRRLGV